ncbi:hypothetical protein HNR06_000057 [Nocardiopsis arvandica]|uniref:Uncharacterized protein n=1 Tax=Nocardiopsis sinuspersici TaxID=501010 RepID=A0A7Y9X7L7_9ACTN|nr:hypothetical protein [Nocardiopsis sinuspersici]NYH50468.1 hypothetical protein [Nocardiopsis sinuspersici]
MQHPPSFTRPLVLAGLLAVLLSAPAMAHASPEHGSFSSQTAEFYTRMLAEHDGVFVEEELAGVLDRRAAADELRALLDEYHVTLDVVVIAGRGERSAAHHLAWAVHERTYDPVLVLPVDDLHIGHADLRASGLPTSAAGYASLTGGWHEPPEDKLERVLRISDDPDVDALAEQALRELYSRADVVVADADQASQEEPPRAALTWREYGWVPWAGGATGALLVYAAAVAALRWYWHGRPARRKDSL